MTDPRAKPGESPPVRRGNARDSSGEITSRPKASPCTQRDAPPETQVTDGARGQRELPEFARSGGPPVVSDADDRGVGTRLEGGTQMRTPNWKEPMVDIDS
ncbi:hypothetical protein GCM10010277_27150 [Streptomyces longisporoflavus]|nr:hypothetical protein GCM10010277_27150 [Streptomyces longisporoflavus]